MKTLFAIIGCCIAVITAFFPGTASASFWNITFTAKSVSQVGRIDDGETIFQGDPDLFFAMQIFIPYPGYCCIGDNVTEVFFENDYESTTNWNFTDQSVSLKNIYTDSTLPPEAYFSFWLYDDDAPLGAPDLLGVDSFTTDSNIASAFNYNNNFKFGTQTEPLVSSGDGWQNNYLIYYSVSIEAVPIPSAVWLFGSGLIGLVGFARRKTYG
jgi:hypothetical protein